MLLAELEVRHSRPFSPTRRVALGTLYLPTDPAPGFGGLLLAALVGACASRLDDEFRDGLDQLIDDVERGRRIVQPRLRHRFQRDIIGLDSSRHKLVGEAEQMELQLDDHGTPMPQILAAVYAAGLVQRASRAAVFRQIRRATRWQGDAGPELLAFLAHDRTLALNGGEEGWAMRILGFAREPTRSEINRRFRELVRDAHPDHGAPVEEAGQRIVDLTAAKRILLSAG